MHSTRNVWLVGKHAVRGDALTHFDLGQRERVARARARVHMRAFEITGIPLQRCVYDNLFGDGTTSKRASRGQQPLARSSFLVRRPSII